MRRISARRQRVAVMLNVTGLAPPTARPVEVMRGGDGRHPRFATKQLEVRT